jgi:hypothetical protein
LGNSPADGKHSGGSEQKGVAAHGRRTLFGKAPHSWLRPKRLATTPAPPFVEILAYG